jgi:DNA-binding phage protein
MTRRERALANNKKRYDEAHKTILSLATGMFADNYKKKDGSFNINKLAKDSGYSRKTIYKHLKDEGLL